MRSMILLFLILSWCSVQAENTCNGRYEHAVFSEVSVGRDIGYGRNLDHKGEQQHLLLDFYEPLGDAAPVRPLVVMLHGGAFSSGDKEGERFSVWGRELARRGYVAASVNYRLGVEQPVTVFTAVDAAVRALQDAKAAVRFFRQHATTYRIDTSQIFVLGTSAGAYTALNLAYLQADELPFFINLDKLGGLEGTSGSPGFSSRVHGVVNMWGAILDSGWVEKSDVPVMNIHGVLDTVVPYNKGLFNGLVQYGSLAIFQRAKNLGLRSDTLLFHNAGHQLDNDTLMLDSAFNASLGFLYSILDCNQMPTTGVDTSYAEPLYFALEVRPNPVGDDSWVRFSVTLAQDVHVALYDLLGHEITTLYSGRMEVGAYTLPLRITNSELAPGRYYCRLKGESGVRVVVVSVL